MPSGCGCAHAGSTECMVQTNVQVWNCSADKIEMNNVWLLTEGWRLVLRLWPIFVE